MRPVHLALSGSSRSGNRRIQPLLGQLAHVVPIPTDYNDFVGLAVLGQQYQPPNLRLPLAGMQTLRTGSVKPAQKSFRLSCNNSSSRNPLWSRRIRRHWSRSFYPGMLHSSFPVDPVYRAHGPSRTPHLPPRLFIAVGLHSCLFRRLGVTSLPRSTLRHAAMFSH